MLALCLRAELTGITNLRPKDSPESPYFYTFRIQCTRCREIHPNWISFTRHATVPLPNSRGEANFVWRCRNCNRDASASITTAPRPYVFASPPTRQTVVEVECRGCEVLEFRVDEGAEWEGDAHVEEGADGEEGSRRRRRRRKVAFEVGLEDGEWFDYDEDAGAEVSVCEVKWEIRRA